MLDNLKSDVVSILSKVRVQQQEEVDRMEEERRQMAEMLARRQQFQHQNADNQIVDESSQEEDDSHQGTFEREERKVGRNEPCPCGSGKKYKQCHGKID
jgi:preprotein translocase subunit SecA